MAIFIKEIIILMFFASENGAIPCPCLHCFHVVQLCRWSSPFEWDQNAIRKSKSDSADILFSDVIIPYVRIIVKCLFSTLKICFAVSKEKDTPRLFVVEILFVDYMIFIKNQ